MMQKRVLMIFVLVGFVLTACGGDEDGDGGSSSRSLQITLPPLTPYSTVAGCPQQELVDWFEKTYFNMQTFVDVSEVRSRTAEDNQRNEYDFVLDQLLSLRNAVNNAPAPSCVDETHKAIVNDMQIIVDHFQLFANAEISASELETRVSRDIQGLKLTIDTLQSEIDPMFSETPTPVS